LTTHLGVVIFSNMDAELMIDERHVLAENVFAEIVVWRLPRSARGSAHRLGWHLSKMASAYFAMTMKQARETIGTLEMPRSVTTSRPRRPCLPNSGAMWI
jgi:hypothetical protein